MKAPDLPALERKLRRGKPLEQAAEEAGVDIAVAKDYLERRRAGAAEVGDDCLELNVSEALHYGLSTLIAATKAKTRRVQESESFGGERGGSSWRDESLDIEAAKALLSFALNGKKLLYAKKVGKSSADLPETPDLFDTAGEEMGNWVFKRIR